MNILHVSDITLSGAPIRIVDLFNKWTSHKARHLVWEPVTGFRKFKTDLLAKGMSRDEILGWFGWADIIHYHNRHASLEVFKVIDRKDVPFRKSIIQIHSPKDKVIAQEDVRLAKLPLAIVAQYQVREWPEANYVVPNVVDVTEPIHQRCNYVAGKVPVVSYAPSNWNARGWDDKGYELVNPLLKRLSLNDMVKYQLIVQQPHQTVLEMKRLADIGIDEIATGSYHLSSLEYLSLGIPCFANVDDQTEAVVKELTGATTIPWIKADKTTFKPILLDMLGNKQSWVELGAESRIWMEKFWNPQVLINHYTEMYEDL